MTECSLENIWYKKRPRKKFRRFFVLLIAALLLAASVVYYKLVVAEHVYRICSDYSYSCATNAVNKAIIDVYGGETDFDEVITVSKNSLGEIEMITANTAKINVASREIANNTLTQLEKNLEKGIPVPVLSFTGIDLLSGYGKVAYMKNVTITNVSCDFDSNFKSVGINQTLHSIYVNVSVSVNIELPLNKKSEKHVTKVMVGETVIIGKVPEMYFNGGLFG